ncbi:MAG: thymidine phosphorylase [Candidatus Marinimicrobia bacterium]|jgi:pyrimidine-nucleoside phosphorylase|nr:thymidine phosphorylase [Candidatus Neomarinimicrobiota bacterium]MBT4361311.1 thymidine phosphorylase [Candidatus Neomarinimicrobiota bacterium]MBT4947940.1 thymidine phosphorylase [Candidatus Neomarinimicrobiota bacterium]MBT5268130.1 thymidine phosphorylase [Candidatus Neomarinimicrobiota bacterium]MBT6011009.1 thymidine phosphorylase [Candidatus Neomarinimicrobiota bacterium]
MIPYQIIEKKSQGLPLTEGEIKDFIMAYTDGSIPDYQMSALLMAIFIKGMNTAETLSLTKVMLESGERMDFSSAPGFVADKHSTGGVGDKVSILLAPILAVLGVHIPMISGRGLGHSGGTLDKLESIPGFNVNLELNDWQEMVLNEHVGLIGQTGNICPADKKIYALRDVTATVRSIPLISASIMSKKIAEGIQGLVLDVKTGNGAFMQTPDDSRALAKSLVSIGKGYGIKTTALITDMNQPLGSAIGNWFEMEESVRGLQGNGPADLMDITYALGAEILRMSNPDLSQEAAIDLQTKTVADGSAFEKLKRITELQGGDPSVLDNLGKYPKAKYSGAIKAPESGYLAQVDTMALGFAGIQLGAGRLKITDAIDYSSGMYIHTRIGDSLNRGDDILTVYSNDEKSLNELLARGEDIFSIEQTPPEMPPLILERIG